MLERIRRALWVVFGIHEAMIELGAERIRHKEQVHELRHRLWVAEQKVARISSAQEGN
jgi:hypothetical protein